MRLLSLLFLISSSLAFADGPFGVAIGSPVTDYPGCKKDSGADGLYICRTLPSPNVEFSSYALLAHDSVGVCRVKALTEPMVDTGLGYETMARFDDLVDQIGAVYGESDYRIMERLSPGATVRRPADWLAAIRKKERLYAAVWLPETGYQPINKVKHVSVLVSSEMEGTSFMHVEFEGENSPACEEAIAAEPRSFFDGVYATLNQLFE